MPKKKILIEKNSELVMFNNHPTPRFGAKLAIYFQVAEKNTSAARALVRNSKQLANASVIFSEFVQYSQYKLRAYEDMVQYDNMIKCAQTKMLFAIRQANSAIVNQINQWK